MILGAVLLAIAPMACMPPPIDAAVVDPFRGPACTWCPGNRGLEYQPPTGTPVKAVAAGTVSFSGVVAGTRYVVVDHADGRRATYGRLASATVGSGALLRSGQVLGTTTDRFFFGIRDGDTYIDPAPLLGRPRYRPRLVPTDGSRSRPAPPPSSACASP